MSRKASPDGPQFPVRFAIPMNDDILGKLGERAKDEGIPKTTLARKMIVDGLKRAAA